MAGIVMYFGDRFCLFFYANILASKNVEHHDALQEAALAKSPKYITIPAHLEDGKSLA